MIVVATTDLDVNAVQLQLSELGATPIDLVAPSKTRRLILATAATEADAHRVANQLREAGLLSVVRPDGGARLEGWRSRTKPITFADRLSVCLAWSEHERANLPALIELGHGGFGAGDHPTTALLIDQLIQRILGQERVLDVGCGSGILGLGALKLGASDLVAVDIDSAAVDATQRHAVLNDLAHQVEATAAPLPDLRGPFDVVLANIARAGIVELATELVGHVAPGGWLAVSGISPSQCSQVADFLRPLIEVERCTSGDWSALVLAR